MVTDPVRVLPVLTQWRLSTLHMGHTSPRDEPGLYQDVNTKLLVLHWLWDREGLGVPSFLSHVLVGDQLRQRCWDNFRTLLKCP